MATKKQTLTAEQAYRGALVNLAQLGFEVRLSEDRPNIAYIRHPLAQTLPYGTDVSTTKVLYSQYKERVEVDGKRVALGEVISRAVQAALIDVEHAQRGLEHERRVEQAKGTQYEALMAAGMDKAVAGLEYTGGKYARSQAESLSSVGPGLLVRLERSETPGAVRLVVEARPEAYARLAKLTKSAVNGTKA